VGYFELKLHKYILGTPETNITSCKKGHNRCPLSESTAAIKNEIPSLRYPLNIGNFQN